MSKLWSKEGTATSALIGEFTVGRDKEFDVLLAEYDVLGSLAHTEMLETVGLLSKEDLELIQQGLRQIRALEVQKGNHRFWAGEVGVVVLLRIGMPPLNAPSGLRSFGEVGAPPALPFGRCHGDLAEGLSRHFVYTISV